jgi:sugar lactone lactonase YvrE
MPSTIRTINAKELASGLLFGEGPRWCEGRLYVSDMIGCKVVAIDDHGKTEVVADVPERPNGLGFLADGTFLYTSMNDSRLYRITPGGKTELHSDMRSLMTGYTGDMVIDRFGRAYVDDVGARVLHGEELRPGRIVIVEPDGSARVGAEDLMFPNGIVITNDGNTLILCETPAKRLTAFDIVGDGELSGRRLYKDTETLREHGIVSKGSTGLTADGICIDAEDGLWLSMLDTGEFVRLDRAGNPTHRISIGDRHAVACALGGDDGQTIYLVATEIPKGVGIFEAMMKNLTKSFVMTAHVDVPRGAGRP